MVRESEKCVCAESVLDLYSMLNTVEKMARSSIAPEIAEVYISNLIRKAEENCGVSLSDVKEKVEEGYRALEEENYKEAASAFLWAKTELKSAISRCVWEK